MDRLFSLSLVLTLFMAISCIENDMVTDDKAISEDRALVTRVSSEYYYHEDSGFLLQEREDPYVAKRGEVVTHYAIEFYPRSIEEYMYLVHLSDDVFIDYIPFGFVPVRELSANDRCQYKSFPDGKKYSVSYSYFIQDEAAESEGASLGLPADTRLPIVYAIWPIDKNIPEEIEHTVCYDVSIPKKKASSRFEGQINLPITIDMYDGFLSSYVPMTGIKVRLSNGSYSFDFYMNGNGSATIRPLMFNVDLTLSEITQLQVRVIYQNPQIIVSRDSLVTPIQKYLGTVGSLWGAMSYNTTYPTYVSHQAADSTKECCAFQAAYYYFNASHDFSSYIESSEYGRIIHASTITMEQADCNAETINWGSTPTVFVYSGEIPKRECIASVIHELGHIHHFYCNSSFLQLSQILREAFASYVGWNVGEQYYYSKGYVKPYDWTIINSQGRQDWDPVSTEIYTPLFVDLTDNYNQDLLVDSIQGVPASVINAMNTVATSIIYCKTYLTQYVGTYFTATELNTHFNYYL